MKKLASIVLRLLVSSGLLWWLFTRHSLADGIMPHLHLMQKEWRWVAAGLACVALGIALTAWRWWLVLRSQAPEVTLRFAMRTLLEATFFNITSLGTLGGDAWRVMAIHKRHPGRATAAGVSVMVDHLAGLLGMAIIFAVVGALALYQWPQHAEDVRTMLRQFGIVLVVASVVMGLAIASLSPGFIRRFGRFTPRRLRGFVDRMSLQFSSVWSAWPSFAGAVLISVIMLTFHFLAFYCGLRAVGGAGDPLPVILAMPIVDMASSLPVSISGLGVREKTFETLMHLLTGMPGEQSVSASLAGWLFSVVWGLVGGIVFISGRSLGRQPTPTGQAKAEA